ncbi:Pkinase-domain-containing protein [Cutaneotrichosporon oleaginosum]|uniref:cAMP-dependent protein kinase n=1 Tax=Cutaneotrichosporon oleaginosum TaxID=879819 RepID=A0A0J0XGH4_9TREE|nr:Pkinase-domain-containing protein [Cutaneotrichosporon oleaginosum]KLT40161.1 Pkinase-domain-containing protein [Cutaneotrichosporon oleaginosum]TXT06874.1 hypothetical protein COLE_06205 [Cutaneotrichosporon oleaginosum]
MEPPKSKFKFDPMSMLLPHERAAMMAPPAPSNASNKMAPPPLGAQPTFRPPQQQHQHLQHQPHQQQHQQQHQQRLHPQQGAHPLPAIQTHYVPLPPGQAAPLSPPASLMSTPPSAWEASSAWGGMENVMEGSPSSAQQWQGRFGQRPSAAYPHGQQAHPSSGRVGLADWEVVETLGTGTFGRVLLVRQRPSYRPTSYHPIFPNLYQPADPQAPSPVTTQHADGQLPHFAMKVLRKSEIVRLKQVEHMNSERRILEKVRHPFIVELHATYQDNLNVYMLLTYVPGGELFSHLRRAGRFSPDVTRFYLASIVLAIDYLHSKNIIYRDLKPENLLLDRSGYLRIADFGFAKVVEDRTFTLCGTPEYLAPEIVLSQGHGKAVDWWALGILAFEMLAGYPPFFDDHPLGIYEKILRNEVSFPSHIDPYAKDFIRGLLTADRTKRLGNLRGGARDVMNHPWFQGVDWGSLERKEIGAPIVPRVGSMSELLSSI